MLPLFVLNFYLVNDGLVHVPRVNPDHVRLQVLLQTVHVHVVFLDLLPEHRQDHVVSLVQLQLQLALSCVLELPEPLSVFAVHSAISDISALGEQLEIDGGARVCLVLLALQYLAIVGWDFRSS